MGYNYNYYYYHSSISYYSKVRQRSLEQHARPLRVPLKGSIRDPFPRIIAVRPQILGTVPGHQGLGLRVQGLIRV